MRKTYSKELKFKIAIEAIRGDLTIAQIISKYQVAESLIYKWKKQLLEHGDKVFEDNPTEGLTNASEIDKLYTKIGKLTLERDFLEIALSKGR